MEKSLKQPKSESIQKLEKSEELGNQGKKYDSVFAQKTENIEKSKILSSGSSSPYESAEKSRKNIFKKIEEQNLLIRNPIPNVAKLEILENNMKKIMNIHAAENCEYELKNKFSHFRIIKSDNQGFYRGIYYANLEKILIDGEESLKNFINLIKQKMEKNDKAEWLNGEDKINIQKLITELQNLQKLYILPEKSTSEVLKQFFMKMLYSESFNDSLILSAKLFLCDFMLSRPDFLVDGKPLIETIGLQSLENYIKNEIMPKNKEIPEIVLYLIPACLEITLIIYNYSNETEDISQKIYSFDAPDKSKVLPSINKIELFISPRNIWTILYSNEIMEKYEKLLNFDKKLDANLILDSGKIIQPDCCCEKYYIENYYNEMIRLNGKITKKCIVCNDILDENTIKKLEKISVGWKKPKLLFLIFSVGLMILSAIYVFTSAKNNNIGLF